MFQLKSLILLMVLLIAATNGQLNNNNTTLRPDDYVNMIRQQYALNIQNFDIEMDLFKQTYAASLDTLNRQMSMLSDSIVQTENKLKSLEVVSPQGKKCVNKYRLLLPTTSGIQRNMMDCKNSYKNNVSNLLAKPLNTRNSLQNYYKNSFERDINICKMTYNTLPLNYTTCVTKVVTDTDKYTIEKQKTFSNQMDAAQCSGNDNIKQTLDCSYTTETRTIVALAETNILVNKCIDGQDECKSCNQSVYTCSDVDYIHRSDISYTSQVMNNPFYRRYDVTNCLMLKIINN
ncbi:hypothetical protein FF38_14000 [Lucilia cuprina]|uniref:Protein TsetseEP domain-containing protein n=1 Tax=Lucilia cuprina TaxID=7375 RepID=A0A0L0CJA8_LUCCU|nr:hypothetical protein FF38_14000 [Lucilia cuprina]